jgi:hypothetical protein
VRDLANGGERWALPPRPVMPVRMRSLAGLLADAVVFVDRRARGEAIVAREGGVLDLAMESGIEDWDELERRWDEIHPAPSEELVAHDALSGRERWRVALEGPASSIACAPDLVCAVIAAPSGALLERVDANGRRVGLDRVPWERPVLAAVDSSHALVVTQSELVCVSTAHPDAVAWRLPLPATPVVDRPNPGDRDLVETSIALANGKLYLRHEDQLYCYSG